MTSGDVVETSDAPVTSVTSDRFGNGAELQPRGQRVLLTDNYVTFEN